MRHWAQHSATLSVSVSDWLMNSIGLLGPVLKVKVNVGAQCAGTFSRSTILYTAPVLLAETIQY